MPNNDEDGAKMDKVPPGTNGCFITALSLRATGSRVSMPCRLLIWGAGLCRLWLVGTGCRAFEFWQVAQSQAVMLLWQKLSTRKSQDDVVAAISVSPVLNVASRDFQCLSRSQYQIAQRLSCHVSAIDQHVVFTTNQLQGQDQLWFWLPIVWCSFVTIIRWGVMKTRDLVEYQRSKLRPSALGGGVPWNCGVWLATNAQWPTLSWGNFSK